MRLAAALLAALLVAPLRAGAPAAPARAALARKVERSLQARWLVELAFHVQWPDGAPAEGPFVIGVLGRTKFRAVVEEAARGRSLDGRPFAVVDMVERGKRAQVLFVPSSQSRRIARIREVAGPGVLLVGDGPGFASSGGGVAFAVRDGRPALIVNRVAIAEAGLLVDPELLELAAEVIPAREGRR